MNGRLITFFIGVAMALGVCYLASYEGHLVSGKTYRDSVAAYQEKMRDISGLVERIQEQRHVDSLEFEAKLKANKKENQRLENNAQKVNFKNYTDPQLDSLLQWLYPGPK